MSNLSDSKKRLDLYHRFRSVNTLLRSARYERDRVIRLAEKEGLKLKGELFYPEPTATELNICKKLLNRRNLSELLAGNQLSITNRYTPKIYMSQVESLKSVILWWITSQNNKGNLKINRFKQ